MPAKLEASLRRGARRAGLKVGSRRWRSYVYGTIARQRKRRRRRKR